MPNQVQCPNCGSYKVVTKLTRVNPISHQALPKINGSYWFGIFVASCLFTILGFVSFAFRILGGLILIGGVFFAFWSLSKKAIIRYDNSCILCGYKWNRLQNEPEPPVTIRPDLIQKGAEEQKRQQEAAEQASRDAAAAAYLQQQRK
jgi:hypothetical protein